MRTLIILILLCGALAALFIPSSTQRSVEPSSGQRAIEPPIVQPIADPPHTPNPSPDLTLTPQEMPLPPVLPQPVTRAEVPLDPVDLPPQEEIAHLERVSSVPPAEEPLPQNQPQMPAISLVSPKVTLHQPPIDITMYGMRRTGEVEYPQAPPKKGDTWSLCGQRVENKGSGTVEITLLVPRGASVGRELVIRVQGGEARISCIKGEPIAVTILITDAVVRLDDVNKAFVCAAGTSSLTFAHATENTVVLTGSSTANGGEGVAKNDVILHDHAHASIPDTANTIRR